jgi:cation diffusion facilitator CzcD-associated flavoprotein CzcO
MCKRPLILSTLYPALSKPNCTVVREKLITYTPTGILSLNESGKELTREFDVIILGTGFNVAQYLEHINVVGRDGVILQDQWREHPEALYGVGIRSVYLLSPLFMQENTVKSMNLTACGWIAISPISS